METLLTIVIAVGVIVAVGVAFRLLKGRKGGSSGNAGSTEGKLQGTLRARARVEEARAKNYRRLKELEARAAGAEPNSSEEREALKAIMGCIGEISKQEGSVNNLINDYNSIEVGCFKQRSFELQRAGDERAMWEYVVFLEADNTKTRDAILELGDAIADTDAGAAAAAATGARTFNRGVIKGALLTRRLSHRDRYTNVESEIDALLKAILNPLLKQRAPAAAALADEARDAFAGMLAAEAALLVPSLLGAEKAFSAKFVIERRMKLERLRGIFAAAAEYLKGAEPESEVAKENAVAEILSPLSKAVIPGAVDKEYKELIDAQSK